MAETADRVVVELFAKTDQAEAEVKRYGRTFAQSMRGVETSAQKAERVTAAAVGGIKNKVLAAAGSITAALSVGLLINIGKQALDYAASLGEVSQQLGVTTRDLQTYRFAATQVGLSQEEMDEGLSKLTKSLGEAALGSKQDAKIFEALGISIKNANGSVKTAGQALPEIADALSKIEDPAKRAAVEIQIFGRAGQKLDTLLAGGSKAIDELRQEAEKLGIILSDEQIQKADETADKIAKLQFQLKQKIAGTVADNAEAIKALADGLAGLVGWLGQAITKLNNFRLAHNRAVLQRLATDAPAGSPLRLMAQKALDEERQYLRGQGLSAARQLNMAGGKADARTAPTVDQNALANVLAPEKRAKSGSGKSDLEKSYEELARAIGEVAGDIRNLDAASFLSELGLQSSAGIQPTELRSIRDRVDAIDERKDAERQATTEIEDDRLRKMQDTVRTVADLYEQAMIGGTNSIAKTLKSVLIRAIAEAIATQAFGSAGAKSGGFFGNVLGSITSAFGFAQGGSFIAGGRPGVDRNSLAINGQTVAKISAGERISVTPAGRANRANGGGTTVLQTIHVDARGAVMNDQFASMILSRANQDAAKITSQALKAGDAAMPGRLARYQTLGS